MSRLITSSVISAILTITLAAGNAEAVVYCKSAGVPKGCVARPPATAGAPGVGGVGSGVGVRPGVGAGAAGVGVRPGVGVNAGGGKNRVGVR